MPAHRVYLDRKNTVELLARLWQTERAVHGLSPIHWPNLLKYYDPPRRKSLSEWLVRIKHLLGPDQIRVDDAVRPPFLCSERKESWLKKITLPFLGLYQAFCNPVLNRMKSGWRFPVVE